MLKHLAETGDTMLRELAWRTLIASEQFRGSRQAIGAITPLAATPTGAKRCTICDSLRLQMPSILPATPTIATMITHPPVIWAARTPTGFFCATA